MVEERRRRRIAFENLAKGMLRYLDNCKEVKVGITILQERVEVPLQFGISIQQVAQQTMNEDGQIYFPSILVRRKEIYVLLAGSDGRRSGKGWSIWKEKKGVKTWVVKYRC